MIPLTILYLFLAYIVALIGQNRKFGFWGYFFIAIFMTPIIGILAVLASDKREMIPVTKKKR